MADDKRLFFKFGVDVSARARADVVRKLKAGGAAKVYRLFPKAKEPELAAAYVADSPSASKSRSVSGLLKSMDEVDLVQGRVRRRPS